MTWPQRFVYVMAIEGLDRLLTNGDTDAVVTAWSGSDWTTATGGLFVDLDQQQSAHPWEPFRPGGTLTATISADDIGVITHRTAGGASTELTASLDQDDTTVSVQSTAGFPSSGHVYIGTESVAYGGVTPTTLTGCTRGKFSPFGTATGSSRYAHNHRVGVVEYGPPLAPHVTEYPREWIGRWVGLWVHEVNADGTLDTKAEATLVFAGRLAEVRDDAESISTVFVVEHVLTDLCEATIGRDMFSGEVADGMYLPAGAEFEFKDLSTAWRNANPLTVVASGAAGANQMDAGFYTHAQLFSKFNAWLAAELAAARVWGTYSFAMATTQGTADSLRTKLYWRVPTGSVTVAFNFTLPKAVAIFLGFDGSDTADALGSVTVGDSDVPATTHHFYKDWVPLRSWVTNGLSTAYLRIEKPSGAFQDQFDTMPASANLPPGASGEWGLFLFDDQVLIRAQVTDNGDGTVDLSTVETVLAEQTTAFSSPPLATYAKRLDDPTPTKIRQVFLFEMPTDAFLNRLMYSGGTAGYNHATYDELPYGCGLAYPGGLFGSAWETSVANMPAADKMIAPYIDKPMKLSALIGSDLLLRHVFPVWRSEGLRMATWQTPSTSLTVATLTEANKAEPAERDVNHRSPTLLSGRWAKNLIKVRYNRELVGDKYRGTINVEDRTAIDGAGDRGQPFTIDARNTLSQFSQTGAGIEDIVPNAFIPAVRMFTKPMRTLKRSINLELWELAPGDIVSTTDNFARDPATGVRSVSSRPGVVVSHRYNPGGARPDGSVAPIVAEAELMFVATNRIYAYAPSALVDETQANAGYDAGTKTLSCYAHAYSESSEDADASRFPATYKVRVTEVDPTTAASPLSWTDTVASQTGNTITLTTGLAGWDTAKRYRVTFDGYATAIAAQRDNAFIADDTAGLVDGSGQPYQYGVAASTVSGTSSAHTDYPERHVELDFDDGAAYDVGSLVGYQRMVDNLIDHKTAIQSPFLVNTALTNTAYTTGYRLVMVAPVFLTAGVLSNSVVRYLKVAPWFRSSDGTATSIRVSLMPTPPIDDTINDVDRGSVYADATWATSSTTWQTPTASLLTINVKTTQSTAWLVIELGYKCESRGLAEVTEQERQVF